ncbi:MAG: MarR family winged helix-turn-helix transcriptional regulator [Dehalococcoidia bacterium]
MITTHELAQIDVDHAPSALITRVSRRLRYRLDARLERYGLTGVQFGVLARLGIRDGQSQGELQQAMGIEGATMTNIVQRLEREGWIRRACDPDDRRKQRVWLGEKAQASLPELTAQVEHHRAEVMGTLTDEESAELSRLLRRIEEILR